MTGKKSLLAVIFGAIIALCCALASGCGEYSDSLQRILAEDEIVFGIEPDNLPMSYDQQGEPGGYSVDIANELAKRLNVDAVFKFVSPSDAQQALDDGLIDIYINLPSPGQKESASMLTADGGMNCRQIIVVPSDSDVSRLYDLRDSTLCVISGSDAADSLDEAPVFKGDLAGIIWCRLPSEQFDALASGDAQGMLINEPMYLYIMDGVNSNYRVLDELLGQTRYVMAMRLHDNRLAERIGSLLEDMRSDGTFGRIRSEWFGE